MFPASTSIETVPHDIHSAVEHALRVLSWQENLVDDEMPPRWMWHLDWELETHFIKVEKIREQKYGGSGGTSSSSSSDEGDPVWDDNVYAARFKD